MVFEPTNWDANLIGDDIVIGRNVQTIIIWKRTARGLIAVIGKIDRLFMDRLCIWIMPSDNNNLNNNWWPNIERMPDPVNYDSLLDSLEGFGVQLRNREYNETVRRERR
jgi:hypothetical protein